MARVEPANEDHIPVNGNPHLIPDDENHRPNNSNRLMGPFPEH